MVQAIQWNWINEYMLHSRVSDSGIKYYIWEGVNIVYCLAGTTNLGTYDSFEDAIDACQRYEESYFQ